MRKAPSDCVKWRMKSICSSFRVGRFLRALSSFFSGDLSSWTLRQSLHGGQDSLFVLEDLLGSEVRPSPDIAQRDDVRVPGKVVGDFLEDRPRVQALCGEAVKGIEQKLKLGEVISPAEGFLDRLAD